MVKMAKKSKEIVAVVQSFEDKKYLNVILEKSIKLRMQWNGRIYEGTCAGMDFESDGPTLTVINTVKRG